MIKTANIGIFFTKTQIIGFIKTAASRECSAEGQFHEMINILVRNTLGRNEMAAASTGCYRCFRGSITGFSFQNLTLAKESEVIAENKSSDSKCR